MQHIGHSREISPSSGARRFYPSVERQQILLEGYHADHPESRYCGNRKALQKLRNCPVNS
ncbi:hypothetical protein SRABI05_01549 [Agrobacterium fabrum]|nr:hypothetical protein SRABI46_00651 [Agrobacterium fabrum]CAH0192715.1 hypothetical protein SRABI05_01549 [Agrobacterium fabrum]